MCPSASVVPPPGPSSLLLHSQAAEEEATKRLDNEQANEAEEVGGSEEEEGGVEAGPKKKKKKKKKKKPASSETGGPLEIYNLPEQDNSILRLVGNWPAVENSHQTRPPTVPVARQFKPDEFPMGAIEGPGAAASGGTKRRTEEELRALERAENVHYQALREAAECHRQVRQHMQSFIRPGLSMTSICEELESTSSRLLSSSGLSRGWGFPTGCSLNECAAHYTPNPGDRRELAQGDICKLDFGTQVGGRIIDCAFTIAFEPVFDNLIQATKDGTNVGIKHAGIDARFEEIAEAIHEAIEAYEVFIDGKTLKVKVIENLTGHNIGPYAIHGGKAVPIARGAHCEGRMEEGELYAIETFASTGKGHVYEEIDCSHFMKNKGANARALKQKSAKDLLKAIEENFSTLAFCRRWLEGLGQHRHLMALKHLVDADIVTPYPPLCDVKGSYTSQMEHTILLRPTGKEVLSRGPDF
eukprot:GHVT01068172.1.p1 GENE.GHVT01068172.1~~GHVT01068172.1.p1  ORF type:complete len:470 (+),score=105.62 GHVT01068172.1:306-1715(+)